MAKFRLTLRMLGTLAFLGALLLMFYGSQHDSLEKGEQPQFPKAMRLLDGQSLLASSLANKPMVVNFWATWCPPCRQELPSFSKVSKLYESSVVFLGVAVDSPLNELVRFQRDFQLTYPIVIGSSDFIRAWKADTLPTTYFLNAKGQVVSAYTGALDEADLIRAIEAIKL